MSAYNPISKLKIGVFLAFFAFVMPNELFAQRMGHGASRGGGRSMSRSHSTPNRSTTTRNRTPNRTTNNRATTNRTPATSNRIKEYNKRWTQKVYK